MCGIIGIITPSPPTTLAGTSPNVVPDMIEGLKRLEYRGYDSAGVAVIQDGAIRDCRAVGKLGSLEHALANLPSPLCGSIGIGHTRWATHGEPSVVNAHPHRTELLAVVHNGIIENHQALKTELLALGYKFSSQTDTEVIAHLLTHHRRRCPTMVDTLALVLPMLKGAFALAIMATDEPDKLYFAREGSPLVLGTGVAETSATSSPDDATLPCPHYVASDAIALAPYLAPHTPHVIYPQDGDWGYVTTTSVHLFDRDNTPVQRQGHTLNLSSQAVSKGEYRHFMEKEIHEQPAVVQATLDHYLDDTNTDLNPQIQKELLKALPSIPGLQRLTIIACGTSFYAGMVAKYWMESLLGLPVDVEIASEFRYRNPALGSTDTHACLVISQSGETVDTLAALRHVKQAKSPHGPLTIGIVNVPYSAIAREADFLWPTLAGPEIGVASTKAFTCQLMALACLTLHLAQARKALLSSEMLADSHATATTSPLTLPTLIAALKSCSHVLQPTATLRSVCGAAATRLYTHPDVLYLGRGVCFPIALEGALKLKELSYIHAEGYAAGELKHGPIALIEKGTPVVTLLPDDASVDKIISNMQEVLARGASVIAIADSPTRERLAALNLEGEQQIFVLPIGDIPSPPHDHACVSRTFVHPFIMTLPLQLLAYETAILKGTDVDQPRNLAKSVTVE